MLCYISDINGLNIMKTTSKHDQRMTEVFRAQLGLHGVSGVEAYEWFADEPLYRGDPINGRATESELKAIISTYRAAIREKRSSDFLGDALNSGDGVYRP